MFITEYEGYDLTKYNEFLIECSKKDYSNENTHKHHFLPKFMGGARGKANIIILSVEDHYKCHVILADCFPENTRWYKGNIFSASYCRNWLEGNYEEMSTRLSKIQKKKIQVGKPHSQEAKDKISKANKGKPRPRWVIEKMNASRRGKKHSEEHKQQISRTLKELYASGKKPVNFGDPNSPGKIAYRKKLSEKGKTQQNGRNNPAAKKIQHIESGRIFDCLKDAMLEFGYDTYNKLHIEVRNGNFVIIGDYRPSEKMKENNSKEIKLIHVETGEIFRSLSCVKEKFKISSYPVLYRLINQGIFKYSNDDQTIPITSNFRSKTKSVIINQTGKKYNSIKDLCVEFGFTQWEFEKRKKHGEFTIFEN